MNHAPIALFVYNRPLHTRSTLEALARNAEAADSLLYIYCDGPKAGSSADQLERIRQTRAIAQQRQWCGQVQVIESPVNKGLAASVIAGVTEIVNRHGNIIVLEDDLLVSPWFLQYMNQGLRFYEHEHRVISIHGYVYPVKAPLPETFFIQGADCWGWATWQRGWALLDTDGRKLLNRLQQQHLMRRFNFNNTYNYTKMLRKQIAGKNDSWAILWYASAFLNNKLTLYPGRSLVSNIGNDGMGTHVARTDDYSVKLTPKPIVVKPIPLQHNEEAAAHFEQYFRSIKPGLIARALRRLNKKLNP